MVFCKIIGSIQCTGFPVDNKLALADTIADPIESHINCLGTFLLDGIIDDSFGTGVIRLDWRGGLWVAKFSESGAKSAGILGVVEASTNFSFSGRGKDISHDDTGDMNGAIFRRWGGISGGSIGGAAEEEKTTSARPCFGFREVRGITVNMENHGAGRVADTGIGVSGSIIKELIGSFGSGSSGLRLGCGKGAKSNKHGAIDGAGIVKEHANDLL